MNDLQKQEIKTLVEQEKARLGSFNSVAKKCKVSAGTINALVNNVWDLISDAMWSKIGAACGWRSGKWMLSTKITNFKIVSRHVSLAKQRSVFTAISDPAGSGKSKPLQIYSNDNANEGVFYIECWEWTGKNFLEKLCSSLGIENRKGYQRVDDLLDQVISFFHERRNQNPQLIIDQYDKLKPSARRQLIPIFNRLEDMLSVVIAGTDALEHEIKRGVRNYTNGYDEIDSRVARSYLKLFGVTKEDCTEICSINGVTDSRLIQGIWKELSKDRVDIKNERGEVTSTVMVVKDMRRLKRLVQRELIRIAS